MKEITILSGKGGTGKTSITSALASVAQNAVFCDNDVDAADLHIIFHPEVIEEHNFSSGWVMTIDHNTCTGQGICIEKCRFGAIERNTSGELTINPFKCEGCRLCERVCPSQAIFLENKNGNYWFVSVTRFGKLVHARMEPGEENSGKLVTQVRKRAREIALENKNDFVINDGSPGIGCATIASLSGTNTVLIVIEPTKSGLSDLSRLVELIESFKTKTYAIINKCNINPEMSNKIESYLKEKGIGVLAKIPFDKEVVEAMIAGKTIVEHNPHSDMSKKMRSVWRKLKC